eukprot:snap_masked-scaffold_3-processed-gene-21.26-mRNA-1 protein AED:1.00 eAED:1.00 QI:0/0/0/0/1/1/2/0/61
MHSIATTIESSLYSILAKSSYEVGEPSVYSLLRCLAGNKTETKVPVEINLEKPLGNVVDLT